MQNTSHAVMAQRHEARDSADDFPTPPWATRALMEHVLHGHDIAKHTCLEPAAGRGYMSRPLSERFSSVVSSDAFPYGYCEVRDFLSLPYEPKSFDWVITNPPFRLAEDFVNTALSVARVGVAILARTVFLESVGRYQNIFRDRPPKYFGQFSERVPMVKGRVDPKASTATGYGWFVWLHSHNATGTELIWLPPCRKALEKPKDYLQSFS